MVRDFLKTWAHLLIGLVLCLATAGYGLVMFRLGEVWGQNQILDTLCGVHDAGYSEGFGDGRRYETHRHGPPVFGPEAEIEPEDHPELFGIR